MHAGDLSRKKTSHQAMDLLNTIVEDFECSICLKHLTHAHISPECLHRFCGDCIKESLRKCNNECPTCRVHIPTKRTLRKDKQFDNIVSCLLCACTKQYVMCRRRFTHCTLATSLICAPNRKSTRKRSISSSRERLREKERAEEETGDDNLQVIFQHRSQLLTTTTTTIVAEVRREPHPASLHRNVIPFVSHLRSDSKLWWSSKMNLTIAMHAPKTKSTEYHSIRSWCDSMRRSYKEVQKGQTPHTKLRLITFGDLRKWASNGA